MPLVTRTRTTVHFVTRVETGDFDGDGTVDARSVIDRVVTTETYVEFEPGEETLVDRQVTTRAFVDENRSQKLESTDRPLDAYAAGSSTASPAEATPTGGGPLLSQVDAEGQVHYWTRADVEAYDAAVVATEAWVEGAGSGFQVRTLPAPSEAQEVYRFPVFGTGGDGWGGNVPAGELRVEAATGEVAFVSTAELEHEAQLIAAAEAQLPPGHTVANLERTTAGYLFEVRDQHQLFTGYATLTPAGALSFSDLAGSEAAGALTPDEIAALLAASVDPVVYAEAAAAYASLEPSAVADVLALTSAAPSTLPDVASGAVYLVLDDDGAPTWAAQPDPDEPYLTFAEDGAPVVGLPGAGGELPLALVQGVQLDQAVSAIEELEPAGLSQLSQQLAGGLLARDELLVVDGVPVLAAHAEQALATLAFAALEGAAADPTGYQTLLEEVAAGAATVDLGGREYPAFAVQSALQLRAFEAMPAVVAEGSRATDPAALLDFVQLTLGTATGSHPPSYGVASLANLTTFAAVGAPRLMGGAIDYTDPDVYAEYLHQLYLPAVAAFQQSFPGAEVSVVAMPGGAFAAYDRSPEGGLMADLQYQLDTLAIAVTTPEGQTSYYSLSAASVFEPPLTDGAGYGPVSSAVVGELDELLHESADWPGSLIDGIAAVDQAYQGYTIPFLGEGGLFQPVTVIAPGQATGAVVEGTDPLAAIAGDQLLAVRAGGVDSSHPTTVSMQVGVDGPGGRTLQPLTLEVPPRTNLEVVFQQDAIRGDVPIVLSAADPLAQRHLVAFQLGVELGLPPVVDPAGLPPEVAAVLARNPPDPAAFSALLQDPTLWSALDLYPAGTPQGDLVERILTHVAAENGPGPVRLTPMHVVVELPGRMPQSFPVFRFARADGSTYFVDHTGRFYEDWDGGDGFLSSPTYPPEATVHYPRDGRLSVGPDGRAQVDSMVSPATVDTFGEHFDEFLDTASMAVGVGVGVVGLLGGPMTWWMSAAAFASMGWQVKEGVERVQDMAGQHQDMASPEALWEYANLGFSVFGMVTMGATSLASLTRAGSGFRSAAASFVAANNVLDAAGLVGDTAFGVSHWEQMSPEQRMSWMFGIAMRAGNTGRGLWTTHAHLGQVGQPNGMLPTMAAMADPTVQRWMAFGPDQAIAAAEARAEPPPPPGGTTRFDVPEEVLASWASASNASPSEMLQLFEVWARVNPEVAAQALALGTQMQAHSLGHHWELDSLIRYTDHLAPDQRAQVWEAALTDHRVARLLTNSGWTGADLLVALGESPIPPVLLDHPFSAQLVLELYPVKGQELIDFLSTRPDDAVLLSSSLHEIAVVKEHGFDVAATAARLQEELPLAWKTFVGEHGDGVYARLAADPAGVTAELQRLTATRYKDVHGGVLVIGTGLPLPRRIPTPAELSELAARAGLDPRTTAAVLADPGAHPRELALLEAQMLSELPPEIRAEVELEVLGRRFVDRVHYEEALAHGVINPEHFYGVPEWEGWVVGQELLLDAAARGQPLTVELLQQVHATASAGFLPVDRQGRIRTSSANEGEGTDVVNQGIPQRVTQEQYQALMNNPYLNVMDLGVRDGGHHLVTVSYLEPERVPAELGELLTWVNEQVARPGADPIAIAAAAQQRFVSIHPFLDGNGRMSRMVMDYVLARMDAPPVVLNDTSMDTHLSPGAWQQEVRDGQLTAYELLRQTWAASLPFDGAGGPQ